MEIEMMLITVLVFAVYFILKDRRRRKNIGEMLKTLNEILKILEDMRERKVRLQGEA